MLVVDELVDEVVVLEALIALLTGDWRSSENDSNVEPEDALIIQDARCD